jgi:hypothetical protein
MFAATCSVACRSQTRFTYSSLFVPGSSVPSISTFQPSRATCWASQPTPKRSSPTPWAMVVRVS